MYHQIQVGWIYQQMAHLGLLEQKVIDGRQLSGWHRANVVGDVGPEEASAE